MAQIIEFPKPDRKKKRSERKDKNEYKADRTAKMLLYLGLSVSVAVLSVGTVLDISRKAVKKVRKKLRK